ncbi:MAG: hypothetical protein K0S80_2939 [Neobacillus sp.]|nr:hypothetical protein [Neobacillus sp.]
MGFLSKWVESLDYEYEILPACTRNISPHSKCTECVEICDKKAITILKEKPIINHNKCVECGKCISACPVQAIAGIYPRRIIVHNQLVIDGNNSPTTKELLIFYSKGIKVITGETSSLIEIWRQPIEKVNSILEQLGEAPFLIAIKSVEKEYFSRRELFSLWKGEGQSILKQAIPAKWRFNQDYLDLQKYYKDYQFTKISLDIEKCTLCSACQKLCSKKCFDIKDDNFFILPQGCSSCKLCVDACPEKAIMVENQISKKEVINISVYKKICITCHNSFSTLLEHNEKCVACSMRENFFGMKGRKYHVVE